MSAIRSTPDAAGAAGVDVDCTFEQPATENASDRANVATTPTCVLFALRTIVVVYAVVEARTSHPGRDL
jgi:hypothetical protein